MKRCRPIGRLLRAAAFVLPFVAAGCLPPIRSIVAELPAAGWSEAAVIRYANTDTLALRDLHLFLRLGDACREDTLTLRIETCTPERLRATEYHRLVLATPRRASTVQPLVELPYRRDVRLREEGDYHFVLTPVRPVQGIEAVGLRIMNR